MDERVRDDGRSEATRATFGWRTVLPRIGWGLMISSVAVWAVLLALPFVPASDEQRLAAAGAILIVAEVLFWLGAVLAGPEAARRMRSWWRGQ